MIKKYVYGKPYLTRSYLEDFKEETGEPLPFKYQKTEKGYTFRYPLKEKDKIYGLGEATGKIDKRGKRWISFASDNGHHEDDTLSLYSAHNFIVIDGETPFGAFFDSPSTVIFDLAYTNKDEIVITSEKPFTLYLIFNTDAYSIIKEHRNASGKSYFPALWGFGYGQSRFSYFNEKQVMKVFKKHQKYQLPLDYICLDIHYMDEFEDFTFNQKRFPDPKGLVTTLKDEGVYLIPIVDCGLKVNEKPMIKEGLEKGYFVKKEDGTPFKAAVWPGFTYFVDFFKKDAKEYFGHLYSFYTDLGIEGFWNDMNEPSIFYSELTKDLPKEEKKKGNPDFEGNGHFQDYSSFFHVIDGQNVNHYEVHNLYGGLLCEACYDGVDKLLKARRGVIFSRSSYSATHRYSGLWTGDNSSTYRHLRLNFNQLLGLNMEGFLFSGADTGGFGGNCSRSLLLRWLALSLWTPLFRNHCAIIFRPQECYHYRKKKDFRNLLNARYQLLPYIYSEFGKAVLRDDILFKPLSFIFKDDETARNIDDQLLFGDSVMICPILNKEKTRKVYLPVSMTEVRYDGKNFKETKVEKGWREIKVPLNELVFYILPDKCVPVTKPCLHTKDIDLSDVTLIGSGTEYEQYLDDGFTKDIKESNIRVIKK